MKKWMKTIPVLAVGAAALTFGWGLTGARAAGTEAELIADNIYIGEVAVGGMTAVEAEEAVNAYVQSLAEETVALSANGNTLTPTVAELGLSEDVDAAVSDAVNYGKTGNLVERYKAQKDLEQTTYRIMADTVCYLQSSPERAQMMDPATYQAYLYYKECCASV